MPSEYDRVQEAAEVIRTRLRETPRLALVLGSGLGALAESVEQAVSVAYRDIPHLPVSTAPGHAGQLVAGRLADQPVVVLSGRVHLYEGYSAEQVVFPLRVMHALGAQALVLTNAAGGVNTAFHPGTLMLITDHINLTGRNPLVGPHDAHFGPRFPDMSEVYSLRLRQLARQVAEQRDIPLAEGVYLGLLGPSYETPAEIRLARLLGADAVGMSTVMEAIAANHLGMEVLGLSCVTNMAAGILPQRLSEAEVIETAGRVRREFGALVTGIVAGYRPIGEETR